MNTHTSYGSGDYLLLLLLSIGFVFLCAWIFSLVFATKKKNKYLKAQTELLARMAKQEGVNREEIEMILKDADLNTYWVDKN